jgi:hypothetical protein
VTIYKKRKAIVNSNIIDTDPAEKYVNTMLGLNLLLRAAGVIL